MRGSVLHTNAFRLAALYFALFAASVLALLVFIYLLDRRFPRAPDRGDARRRDPRPCRAIRARARRAWSRSSTSAARPAAAPITCSISHRSAAASARRQSLAMAARARQMRPGWFLSRSRCHAQRSRDSQRAGLGLRAAQRLSICWSGAICATPPRSATGSCSTLAWSALLIRSALGIAGGAVHDPQHAAPGRGGEPHQRAASSMATSPSACRYRAAATNSTSSPTNLNAMLDQIERLMVGMRQVTDNIAHDLRTPLSRLRARLEVTLAREARCRALRRGAARDHRRGRSAARHLQRAPEHRRGRGGLAARQRWTVVDLAEIARTVAELYEPVAEEKGLALSGRCAAAGAGARRPPSAVAGDRQSARQCAQIHARGPCRADARAADRRRRGSRSPIAVPASPPTGARRCSTASSASKAAAARPATGLGLSLVRAVARLHAGTAWLEDNKPGLKAMLTLPIAPEQAEPASSAHPALAQRA